MRRHRQHRHRHPRSIEIPGPKYLSDPIARDRHLAEDAGIEGDRIAKAEARNARRNAKRLTDAAFGGWVR